MVNPLHMADDAPLMRRRLGAARSAAGRPFAFRSLLDGGVPLSFGSDWPVVDLDARGAVEACVKRWAG